MYKLSEQRYICGPCVRHKEACYYCGGHYCITCDDRIKRRKDKLVCHVCFAKNKCQKEECDNLAHTPCTKCRGNRSEQKFCVEHHPALGMCYTCANPETSTCSGCGKQSPQTWTHPCGTFCTNCRNILEVDRSPKSVNGAPVISIYRYVNKCEKCVSPEDIVRFRRTVLR